MKLVYCNTCHESFGLRLYVKKCLCGRVAGKYNEDGDTVTVSTDAVLFGFCNHLRRPERFGIEHADFCSNAWPYPENQKVTRVAVSAVLDTPAGRSEYDAVVQASSSANAGPTIRARRGPRTPRT